MMTLKSNRLPSKPKMVRTGTMANVNEGRVMKKKQVTTRTSPMPAVAARVGSGIISIVGAIQKKR